MVPKKEKKNYEEKLILTYNMILVDLLTEIQRQWEVYLLVSQLIWNFTWQIHLNSSYHPCSTLWF